MANYRCQTLQSDMQITAATIHSWPLKEFTIAQSNGYTLLKIPPIITHHKVKCPSKTHAKQRKVERLKIKTELMANAQMSWTVGVI